MPSFDHVGAMRRLGVLGTEPRMFNDKTSLVDYAPRLDAQPLLDAIGTAQQTSLCIGQEVLPDGGAVAVGGRSFPLPLCPSDAAALYDALSPSPVGVEGRGDVVDETRRRSREGLVAHTVAQPPAEAEGNAVPPSVILPPALAASNIAATLPDLADRVRTTLCPDAAAVEIVPYKLVGYAEGDFFGPHVDTTSDAAHCGTVSLHLPLGVDLDRVSDAALVRGTMPGGGSGRGPSLSGGRGRGELILYCGRWPASWDDGEPGAEARGDAELPQRWDDDCPAAPSQPPQGTIDLTGITNDNPTIHNGFDAPSLGDCDTSDFSISLSDYSSSFRQDKGRNVRGKESVSARPPKDFYDAGAVPLNWAAWLTDVVHEVARLDLPPVTVLCPEGSPSAAAGSRRIMPKPMTKSESLQHAAAPVPLDRWPMFRFVVTFKVYRRGRRPAYTPPNQSAIIAAADAYLATATKTGAGSFTEKARYAMSDVAAQYDSELGHWMLEASEESLQGYTTSDGTDVLEFRRFVDRPPVEHLGFILHHRYPPAGLRPWTLRGVDRDLYLALSLEHRCAVAPAVFDRFDYMSAPYRLKQQWARTVVVSNTPALLPTQDLADDNAAETLVGGRDDVVLSTAWVQLGFGALLGGGQSYGNGDCEAAWWYRGAVLVASGRHDGWRHTVRWALLLRDRSANPKWREAMQHVVTMSVVCQFL